jgi:ABC-2 type transport system permease protein
MSIFKKKETETAVSVQTAGSARRSRRRGAFSAGIVTLAVAAVIVFNLLVAQFPASKVQIDLTDSKIYNITDVSVNYLNGMTDDVAIHVLADESSVDSRIVKFLDKYVSLSDHLSLEYVNPTVYPSVLSKYGADANTIVVTCEATGRQEIVNISDIIGIDEMMYYMYQQTKETSFDAEGQLTSAIDGVLTSVRHTAYLTSGHEEGSLSQDVIDALDKLHMTVNTINLLTDGAVPDDCDLLIIDAPTRDLANDELTMLREYLAQGGQMIYCMASSLDDFPNFDALCSDYGLSVAPGMVTDTQRYYQGTPFLFFPTLDTSVDAAESLDSDATIMLFGSRGMTVTSPVRDTITVSPFLTTSDKGVAVSEDNSQVPGSYVVGAVATETVDDNLTARLTVFGCDSLCGTKITSSFPNVDNSALFLASITAGFKDVSPISIEPVSLAEETNTVTTGGLWGLLFIFVLPAALLIFGFVRWTRRRKL